MGLRLPLPFSFLAFGFDFIQAIATVVPNITLVAGIVGVTVMTEVQTGRAWIVVLSLPGPCLGFRLGFLAALASSAGRFLFRLAQSWLGRRSLPASSWLIFPCSTSISIKEGWAMVNSFSKVLEM